MNCLRAPTSWDDVQAIAEACGGPDWLNTAILGLEALVVILIVSAILAAVIVNVRHR